MKQPHEPGPSFERLAFSDLHINAATLENAVSVLRRVGEVAAKKNIPVVCTGDLWDKRGVLATRQVDAILNEIDIWLRNGVYGILIPGNHDQVALNGKIHAMRIFDPFPNILVVTDRLLDHQNRIAYIPWREDPQDQGMQFLLDPPGTWTIFGHAEVRGALANNGNAAAGRVTPNMIQAVARACYLGHYHKRQKVGDRTWYLGNPFQLDIGERDQPKGVALITSAQVDPQFFDFEDFPKYHRLDLRPTPDGKASAVPPLKANDIVEIIAEKQQLRDPEMKRWIEALPVADVRQKPVPSFADAEAPAIAMTVAAAVAAHSASDASYQDLGLGILAEVQHLSEVADPIGTTARVLGVTGTDFCKLRGSFSMALDRQGAVMIRGPQGAGKTALTDAISWCLYDRTSPRKPGGDATGLQGDKIINDYADETVVTVPLEVDGDRYEVTRKKKRGKGSRVRVRGPYERPDGISDDQVWVDRLIGLSYPLWRSCISLGQGAVANFLTSTDKHRKALLSDAHGLGVCVPARKATKKKLAVVEGRMSKLNQEMAGLVSVVEHMERQDFDTEAAKWAADREVRKAESVALVSQCDNSIAEADRHLGQYDELAAQLVEIDGTITKLERQTSEGPGSDKRRVELVRAMGAAEAERSVVERDKGLMVVKLQQLIASSQGQGHGICPTCSQKWERAGVDTHVAGMEATLQSKDMEMGSLTSRISNYEMELAGITGASAGQREKLQKALTGARETKAKVGQAKSALDKIKQNREIAVARKDTASQQLQNLEGESNPFQERAAKHLEELESKRNELEYTREEIEEENQRAESLRFWVDGFGPNGLPVIVMRAVVGDLEATANEYLSKLTTGHVWAELSLAGDSLDILFHEYDPSGMVWRERRYEQLSGGQRRCAELAFSPFGLSEMLFRRLRCKVPLMIIDELTTHLGQHEKGIACDIIHSLDRETVIVIDHDPTVQGEFDVVYDLDDSKLTRTR